MSFFVYSDALYREDSMASVSLETQQSVAICRNKFINGLNPVCASIPGANSFHLQDNNNPASQAELIESRIM